MKLAARVLAAAVLAAALTPVLPTPGARAADLAHQLYVVADSVGLGARDAIPRAFPGWDVTVAGRPAVFTGDAEHDYVDPAAALPEIVVVATGYNYPFWDRPRFDADVDNMVNALVARGVRHVVWVNLREVKPQYVSAASWAQMAPFSWYFPEVNSRLQMGARRHPEMTIADWASIADQPDITYDAIHLNPTGAALYARLLRSEVDGFTRLKGGQTLEVPVAGTGGVPADAAAVVLNVTATDPKYAGYITVEPCGIPAPKASNLNYTWNTTVANHVVVKPGIGGKVCVFTYADAHVLVDLAGWIPASGAGFTGITPTRVYDSRTVNGGAALAAGGTAAVSTAAAGVPSDAVAVVLNMTAVDPSAPGYLSVAPCPSSTGSASSVNYSTGETVADLAITPLAADGTVCVQTFAPAHVVVDVMGWFSAGAPFTSVTPRRIVDTRTGLGGASGPVAAQSVLAVDLPAVGGVPAGALAAALTVTVTDPRSDGYATVFPCGANAPVASDLNYAAGASVPALTLASLPADGRVCIFTYATADVIVDVSGWVSAGEGYVGITPTRLVDTRQSSEANHA